MRLRWIVVAPLLALIVTVGALAGCPNGGTPGPGLAEGEGEGEPAEGEGEGEGAAEGEGEGDGEGDGEQSPPDDGVQFFTYEVVNVYPHDPYAFTQGLVIDQNRLYEGTGRWNDSSLRRVDLETGEVQQILMLTDIGSGMFGEGITVFEDRIIQLTWQSGRGFVYQAADLGFVEEFSYSTEGWGLTHDGSQLIMSDGTSRLYFRDPDTLERTHFVEVTDEDGTPVTRLNELEFVLGEVYANIWLTDSIVIIDPETGQVTGWIDMQGLLEPGEATESGAVLNGIAYNTETGQLFVTGKLWPKLFEIVLVPVEE